MRLWSRSGGPQGLKEWGEQVQVTDEQNKKITRRTALPVANDSDRLLSLDVHGSSWHHDLDIRSPIYYNSSLFNRSRTDLSISFIIEYNLYTPSGTFQPSRFNARLGPCPHHSSGLWPWFNSPKRGGYPTIWIKLESAKPFDLRFIHFGWIIVH